jgi:hypothetical protein
MRLERRSFVVACADRELIVDIGEDRDVRIDSSRDTAAELEHGRLIHQLHDVRSGIDGVGLSPPIPPEIGSEIGLPDLIARGDDRPFAAQSDTPARPRRIAERDVAEPVIVLPEGNLLPQDLTLRLKHETGPHLWQSEWSAALQGRNEARAVGVQPRELGAGRAAIPGSLQHGVEIPAARSDMRPIAARRPCGKVDRSGVGENVGGRR